MHCCNSEYVYSGVCACAVGEKGLLKPLPLMHKGRDIGLLSWRGCRPVRSVLR